MKRIITLIILVFVGCSSEKKVEFQIQELVKYSQTGQSEESKIIFSYPEIKESSSPFAESINDFIIQQLKGEEQNSDISLQEIQDKFINEYTVFKKEFPQSSQIWAIEKIISVSYNKNNIFGLTLDDYSYLGGAHPNTFISYFSINLETGEKIKKGDIFILSKLDKLNLLAEEKFRKVKNLSEDTNYESEGYFIKNGQFILNDNFLITDSGIKFLYNNYEIAAYAVGKTTIEFTFEELKDFLRKDSILKF